MPFFHYMLGFKCPHVCKVYFDWNMGTFTNVIYLLPKFSQDIIFSKSAQGIVHRQAIDDMDFPITVSGAIGVDLLK